MLFNFNKITFYTSRGVDKITLITVFKLQYSLTWQQTLIGFSYLLGNQLWAAAFLYVYSKVNTKNDHYKYCFYSRLLKVIICKVH